MVSIVLAAIVFVSAAVAGVIILKKVSVVAIVPEEELASVGIKRPQYKKAIDFFGSKQKTITVAVLTKTVRGLKAISLKTDNLATSLRGKIKSDSKENRDNEVVS